MAYTHKPNNGSLWRNKDKKDNSHPDHKGDGKLECPSCGHTWLSWISAWVNTTRNGDKYFSLRLRPKEKVSSPPPEEDIPF